MIQTDEFKRILRKNDKDLEVSLKEADDSGVIPFRSRKKRNSSFNKQEGNFQDF